MDRIECVVIGAGVVGLAIARAMAARGREVIVLEAGEAVGTGTSSRNSEVIHAGLYYPRGSLKAGNRRPGRIDLPRKRNRSSVVSGGRSRNGPRR